MSRWQVIAADAADYNAITDGPNPVGPNFADNANNSFEQENALKTWVDMALDEMSRGAMEQEVIAKLAHDGCPAPEEVYARAIEAQAQQANEVQPELTEQPEQLPAPDDTSMVSPPMGVQASVQEDNVNPTGIDVPALVSSHTVAGVAYDVLGLGDGEHHSHYVVQRVSDAARIGHILSAEEMPNSTAPDGYWVTGFVTQMEQQGIVQIDPLAQHVASPPPMAPPMAGQAPAQTAPAAEAVTYPEPTAAQQQSGMVGIDQLKAKLMEAEAQGDQVTAQAIRQQIATMWGQYTGRVSVGNISGKMAGVTFDLYGRAVMAVEQDNGQQIQVDATKAEPADTPVGDDPVSEIQTFIDGIPEVQPNDIQGVHARIQGLQEARNMVLAALNTASSAGDTQTMGVLQTMRTATTSAIKSLQDTGKHIVTAGERDYLLGQPQFEIAKQIAANGGGLGVPAQNGSPDFDAVQAHMAAEASTHDPRQANTEQALIMVSELPELMLHDAAAINDLAAAWSDERTAGLDPDMQRDMRDQYCQAVEAARVARLSQTSVAAPAPRTASTTTDADGPAEALFVV